MYLLIFLEVKPPVTTLIFVDFHPVVRNVSPLAISIQIFSYFNNPFPAECSKAIKGLFIASQPVHKAKTPMKAHVVKHFFIFSIPKGDMSFRASVYTATWQKNDELN